MFVCPFEGSYAEEKKYWGGTREVFTKKKGPVRLVHAPHFNKPPLSEAQRTSDRRVSKKKKKSTQNVASGGNEPGYRLEPTSVAVLKSGSKTCDHERTTAVAI